MSNTRFDRLVTKLRELFQLDQPELDFGIYRILHARADEITAFLESDLLPQVKDALAAYQPADKAALEAELKEAIAQASALGADPDALPKVLELRDRLENEAVDLGALEADVYDHLYRFFARYYHEGDFISLRRYKEGVYAIPYEGEEVKLYWANHDQYYIKTAEYLRDYAFRLRPENGADPMRVHFRLTDATEGEHGNVKEAEGKKRVFVLAGDEFIAEEPGESGVPELVLRFEYRPAMVADWPEAAREGKDKPPAQKDLLAAAEERVLAEGASLARWIDALGERHTKTDGSRADYSRLRAHLDRYSARNTFDYFIHKDLGGFLRRELDFYIKSEVMRLDDIDDEAAPRVEQYLSKIKVIRRIALKIIDFLAQLEDFQKKLWLKKKFVTETSWCVSIATVLGIEDEALRTELLAATAANDAQRAEWVALHGIDSLEADLERPAYSEPLSPEFVAAYPTLMIDTRRFEAAFVERLLSAVGDLDRSTDGIAINGDNRQGLGLITTACKADVDCVYIDPPYNTGDGDFAYKDTFRHSSWIAMMYERLLLAAGLCAEDACAFVSLDANEASRFSTLMQDTGAPWEFIGNIAVVNNAKGRQDAEHVATAHEHLVLLGAPLAETFGFQMPSQRAAQFDRTDEAGRRYELRDLRRRGGADRRQDRPQMYYPLYVDSASRRVSIERTSSEQIEVHPVRSDGSDGRWRWGPERTRADVSVLEGVPVQGTDRWNISYRVYLEVDGVQRRLRPKSFWMDPSYSTDAGGKLLKGIIGDKLFDHPKAVGLIADVIDMGADPIDGHVLDYFAGSGTTGHAVINLNREDGGSRRFILVEMGTYFDTVLLPRLKKVTFAPEWKGGRPKRLATPEETERSPRIFKVVRLESYEDTLNNLELRRSETQQSLLDTPDAVGADGLKEQYLLGYMLDVESRGSASLLNVSQFIDPRAYTLKMKRPGSDETREATVDLLETFDWLLGLRVHHIAAPQSFSAAFKRDEEGRLKLDGRLKTDPDGAWWFRTVEGEAPDGRKVLVIWRNRPGGDGAEGIEQDSLVLDEWFTRQGYSAKDSEFDLIYVNGDNNLENLKDVDDRWKVRLIEEEFFRLMFDVEDV